VGVPVDEAEIQSKISEISERWAFKEWNSTSKAQMEEEIKRTLAGYGMVANIIAEEVVEVESVLPDEIVMLLDRIGLDAEELWAVEFHWSQETGLMMLQVKYSPAHEWQPVEVPPE
jgi:hypothetical protein